MPFYKLQSCSCL